MLDDKNRVRPLGFGKAQNHIRGGDYLSSANFCRLETSTPPAPASEECPLVTAAQLSHSALNPQTLLEVGEI